MISFGEWGEGDPDNGGLTAQTHIIAADGTGERVLASPPGTDWQAPESWSNDGTRLLVIRGDGPDHTGARPAIIPVDGHDTRDRDRLAEHDDVAHGTVGMGVGAGRFVDPGNAGRRERREPRAGAAGPGCRHLSDIALAQRQQRQRPFVPAPRTLSPDAEEPGDPEGPPGSDARWFKRRRPPPCR